MSDRERRDSLTPPVRKHVEDPGARELDSDSDDHFSDAVSAPAESSSRNSPIPRTRVEKVSDDPSYGEVPGTEAYRMREGDAAPDEIAIVPDRDGDELAVRSPPDRPSTPGGHPIPKTMLEESADGDGAKTPDGKKHQSDPLPDLVVKADGTREDTTSANVDAPIPSPALNSPDSTTSRRKSSTLRSPTSPHPPSAGTAAMDADEEEEGKEEEEEEDHDRDNEEGADDDGFGDDFDDFEEGGDGDEDDFGDFGDEFQAPPPAAPVPSQPQPQPSQPSQPPQQPAAAPPTLSFPIPDFDDFDPDDVLKTAAPYLNGLYPVADDALPAPQPLGNTTFLTPRSASLWAQLVAPPPLQPPDWIRSRIRRLFLVSLGVPVDLDEILPASKQKKLVLPSLAVRRNDSPRTSTDDRPSNSAGAGGAANNSVARLKQSGANGSNSSVDSQGGSGSGRTKEGASSRKRKGPPPPPDLDLVAAQQLCATTDAALDGMTDAELQSHAKRLEALESAAQEVLAYWTKRTDEKIGDREAFEGVIENLVAHARKTRK